MHIHVFLQNKDKHKITQISKPFNEETCDVCHGSGVSGDGTCSSCNGKGII